MTFAIALTFPARWGVRIGAAAVLAGAALVFLSPATPWEELQGFEGLGVAVVAFLFLSILCGVAVRLVLELMYGRSILSLENRWLRGADFLLSAAAGLLVGTFATLLLAVGLSGQSGGLTLHLWLSAGFAGLAAVGFLWTRGMLRPFLTVASAAIAVLILVGGTHYPRLIDAEAFRLHPGHPRCLRTPDQRLPTADERRLLTLPEAYPFIAGLTLTVMLPDGPKHYRWSYRSMRFRTYNSYAHGACPLGTALP